MTATKRPQGRVNLKRWFQLHTWSAFISLIILFMLAVTGILIYPMDQFGLRDLPIHSQWLPSRYEVNTWKDLIRSLVVTPEGGIFATHRHGIFFSEDEGQSWQDMTEKIPGRFDPNHGLFPPVLALHPYNEHFIIASKGQGLALSTDGGKTWQPYGESDDEDLSRTGIQEITFLPPDAVLVVDDKGFMYRRVLDPEEDDGWELYSVNPPYGEQSGGGVMDWRSVALYTHNGQVFSDRYWWVLNHSFGLILIFLAITGLVVWYRRKKTSATYPKPKRLVPSKLFRTLHHGGGLLSWPLLLLFPLTGIVLLHYVDFSVLVNHGLPSRWFPSQFDHNRWKGPVRLNLHTLVLSRNNASLLWAGHTYGLFASEDGGQHWTNIDIPFQVAVEKQIEHVYIGPWWFDFVYVGNTQELQVSRNNGGHWTSLLDQPVDALYASRDRLYIASGTTLFWQDFSRLVTSAPPNWQTIPLAPPYGAQRSIRQTHLYQLLHDFHSGKLLGTWFKYLLDIVAGLMILQNVTGLFLWWSPRWKRWQRSRLQARKEGAYAYQNPT